MAEDFKYVLTTGTSVSDPNDYIDIALLHELCIGYEDVYVDALNVLKFIITLFLNAGVPINAVDAEGKHSSLCVMLLMTIHIQCVNFYDNGLETNLNRLY